MAMKLSGRCSCGAVDYECETDPYMMFNCHCRDCQRATGTAYVLKSKVQVRGEPRYHRIAGDSGGGVERGFCAACGSQLLLKLERFPQIVGLQAGSLDDPSQYRPTKDVFTSSAQHWDYLNPALEKHTHEQPT